MSLSVSRTTDRLIFTFIFIFSILQDYGSGEVLAGNTPLSPASCACYGADGTRFGIFCALADREEAEKIMPGFVFTAVEATREGVMFRVGRQC